MLIESNSKLNYMYLQYVLTNCTKIIFRIICFILTYVLKIDGKFNYHLETTQTSISELQHNNYNNI